MRAGDDGGGHDERTGGRGAVTARLLPADPEFATASERLLATTLRDQLPDDAVVVCGQRFAYQGRDLEADLVVAWPGVGVAVVEVKGGSVWRSDGQWWQEWSGGPRRVHPVDQARRCRYALRDVLRRHSRVSDLRAAHFAAFPTTDLPEGFTAPDAHRWMLLDRADVARAADRIKDGLERTPDGEVPTREDVEALVACLTGPSVPPREVLATLREREAACELLTREQARVLDGLEAASRVEVRGGAGTGKTWLALEKARRLGRSGQRVALMCYSRGLAASLEREVAPWPRRERPAYVGTFHGLAARWGAPPGSDDDGDYWERRLPEQMASLATALPIAERFDAVVVDEAQDFDAGWWPAVLAVLRSPQHGCLYVFTDDGQRVFGRRGRPAVDLVPFTLTENLRNTQQIAQVFGSLAPAQMRYRGGDGPAVSFVPCAAGDAVARADEVADGLLDDGWPASSVALLTTHHRHPVQVERQAHGQDAYWATFWEDDDLFYGHVLGFKGLERPAVVLAVDGFRDPARAREMLYVGLSRARDLLVVCGDPEQIRVVGGEGVARRLLRPHPGESAGQGSGAGGIGLS